VPDRPTEIPLLGGIANRGLVVGSGQTVRRPQRATSAEAHALLRQLEEVGFDGAPRFLGTDARGREVLSYITGQNDHPSVSGLGCSPNQLSAAWLSSCVAITKR
jgi:hypothetical protein